jgi:hypothetical protein
VAPRGSRKGAIDEVGAIGLQIQTIGAACGQALESQEDNVFTVIDNLLNPAVSLTTSFRDIAAFWIESFRIQARLRNDIYTTLLDPLDGPAGPLLGIVKGNQVSFKVPNDAQATDPVIIDVPVELIGQITLGAGRPPSIPPSNIYVSVSSESKEVQVALVDLKSIEALQTPNQTCTARLDIAGRDPINISVVRST